jgi:hypothetical protein
MAEVISINVTSVVNILNKMQVLQEEMKLLFLDSEKAILNAELEGWNDKNYHQFADTFLDTKTLFLSLEKKIDEEHIPFLKKMIRTSAEFE